MNLQCPQMTDFQRPHNKERSSGKFPALLLAPPALLLRHDHRPADAVFLRQPKAAIAFRIGARAASLRMNGDARARLGGQFLRGGLSGSRRQDARRRRENKRQEYQEEDVLRHISEAHPPRYWRNGRSFGPLRQPLGDCGVMA